MNGGGDGIVEALVGVGSEINGERRFGSDGTGYFDVQHNLAVGSTGIAGRLVMAVVNGDGYNFRRCHLQSGFEVALDVARPEAATQFDDGDALARAIRTCGEVIELGNLHRGEGAAGLLLLCACTWGHGGVVDAKMGFRLRTVVEPKDSGDDSIQFRGDVNGAAAAAVRSAGKLVIQ